MHNNRFIFEIISPDHWSENQYTFIYKLENIERHLILIHEIMMLCAVLDLS